MRFVILAALAVAKVAAQQVVQQQATHPVAAAEPQPVHKVLDLTAAAAKQLLPEHQFETESYERVFEKQQKAAAPALEVEGQKQMARRSTPRHRGGAATRSHQYTPGGGASGNREKRNNERQEVAHQVAAAVAEPQALAQAAEKNASSLLNAAAQNAHQNTRLRPGRQVVAQPMASVQQVAQRQAEQGLQEGQNLPNGMLYDNECVSNP